MGSVSESKVPDDFKARMVAWYLLSHLKGEFLSEACRSVIDSYSSYITSLRPVLPKPEVKRFSVSGVKTVERPTVRIDVD